MAVRGLPVVEGWGGEHVEAALGPQPVQVSPGQQCLWLLGSESRAVEASRSPVSSRSFAHMLQR